jgi:bifunctional N-acetylglucosamine-1-phosphate-uridyltransferase/glucosamine-1-phosphate-acetyltransferase GlmU-like protein
MHINMSNYRVLIPAGGRSSRSGLSYPKSLYRLGGVPILIKICRTLAAYDTHPVIVINPAQEPLFTEVLHEFGQTAQLVFQHQPLGMGNAILQADAVIDPAAHVILVWSDIPLLGLPTVQNMLHCHTVFNNDFTLVTALTNYCYTIVKREDGHLRQVAETRALGIEPLTDGERDIGLFVFKKQLVFDQLANNIPPEMANGTKEHGFLYIIETLVQAGYRAEGYPLAQPNDLLSFNTPDDLSQIEHYLHTDK